MITLKILDLRKADSPGQQSISIELEGDVTLIQARNLAKQIKRMAFTKLKVSLETNEEIIDIK